MTTGASGAGALVTVALRGGGDVNLWPDRLESAGVSYPLADIAWAGLVNDPAAPQGMPPAPAVAWRMADGRYASATPADPPQAWRILEALFAQRPNLRTPLPPPSGYPPVYGGYAPQGSYGYAPQQQQADHSQTVMAGLAHLSIFFGALIVPLILWLVNRGKADYAAQQSKQAFFFHLAVWIIELVVLIPGMLIYFTTFFAFMDNISYTTDPSAFPFASLGVFFIVYGIAFVVQIVAIVFGVIGAIKAFQGQPFHYPLMARV